ncbi:DUF4169 family protein [Aliiroseovarius sp. S1339]|uniref:DUF4169 family protein n=1 Tax=Aliiroseovarius sp. S1339 TaxID=2936990 RepID=UPI0020BF417A|nr:DUF4169 family protein [Aliiroseovarius sp. S1339]MCK8463817.1 DUF4169 family protein [Aliiroseovarius sp. S1339]
MGKPVSLSKHRKAKNRVKKRAQANENAVKFGRTLADKQLDKARAEKLARDLNGHKRDGDTQSDKT